jgi:DNA-binding MarR family transcriptional regulator
MTITPYAPQAVLRTILRSHRILISDIEKLFEEAAAPTISERTILHILEEHGSGGIRLQQIAESLRVSKSGVTRLVERLVRKGWATRQDWDKDRRVVYAFITPEGTDALDLSDGALQQAYEQVILASLDPQEVETLVTLLDKFTRGSGSRAIASRLEEESSAELTPA